MISLDTSGSIFDYFLHHCLYREPVIILREVPCSVKFVREDTLTSRKSGNVQRVN